jgi:hypothetical protein
MHDLRVRLGQLTSDLEEYVESLNVLKAKVMATIFRGCAAC